MAKNKRSPEQMLDETDRRILGELCRSSKGSYREISRRLSIHPATLISRVERLESRGIIRGYTAKIDYDKVGYGFLAIVELTIPKKVLETQNRLRSLPGVLGIYDVTGDTDSILFVACKNTPEFNKLIKKIHEIPGVEKTNTHVVLNVIKDPNEFVPV